MAVMTYEGVVENGIVRLPTDVQLPERAIVYVVVPGGAVGERSEDAMTIELLPLTGTIKMSTPRLVRQAQQEVPSIELVKMVPDDAGV